ncbi:MAG TPA: FMN-dependent NADH-azoreductase [Burkholderiales bacterium]|nr:FMN-dependent NADH-azoreductase [Burkholderiales bacterium]
MKNILFVASSSRGQQSYSYQFATHIVDDLKARHPGAKVVVRDLAKQPLPHVDEAFVNGRALPPEQRGPSEAKAFALSDVLLAELEAADVVVFAVPMYNFGVPSSLKAWIDHVVRPGRAFYYTEKGPQGLLNGKKAVVVVARGGIYSEGPAQQLDFQESYLRAVLGFIGITNVHVVRVEGVGMGEQALKNAMASAKAQTEEVVREFA